MVGCKVLQGTPGLVMQLLLGIVSLFTLLVKWRLSGDARRSIRVFVADVFKQVAGWAWIHVLNIVVVERLPYILSTRGEGMDECDWYWLTIMTDTTIGTLILFALLRGAQRLLFGTGNFQAAKVAAFGNYKGYGTSMHPSIGVFQLILWLVLVTLMKIIMVAVTEELGNVVTMLVPPGGGMVWLWHHPEMKLLLVMVATPAVMNSLQYLIVDTFLESRHNKSVTSVESAHAMPQVPQESLQTPLAPAAPVDEQPGRFPRFVSFHDVADYVDKQSQLLLGDDFLRWCGQKDGVFRECFGLDQLSDNDVRTLFKFIAGDGAPGVKQQALEDGFHIQRQLVEVFNSDVDIGGGGRVTLGQFCTACEKKPAVAVLFGLGADRMESSSSFSQSVVAHHWRNNIVDPYPFAANVQARSGLGFNELHVFLHRGVSQSELKQRLTGCQQ